MSRRHLVEMLYNMLLISTNNTSKHAVNGDSHRYSDIKLNEQ